MRTSEESSPLALDIRADILAALKASGDWWRLRRLFREQLEDCGWRDKLKRRFRQLLREAEQRALSETGAAADVSRAATQGPLGFGRINLDELIDQATADLDLAIPETVQEVLLREVRESVCSALACSEDAALTETS
jgi:hypothetical protein